MLIKWITNSKMRILLEQVSNNINKGELELSLSQLKNLLDPSFKKVKDCVIIAEENITELEDGFEEAVKMYMDKTGYEAANTETRINDYFKNEISPIIAIQIALIVIEIWASKLKQLEPNSKFCLIICGGTEFVEIRFHKIHTNESSWLASDIESYTDGPIGYALI